MTFQQCGEGKGEGCYCYISCHSNQLFCVIIYSSLRSRISSSSSNREKTHATISVHLPRATPIAHCHQGEVAIKILMMCHIHRHRHVCYVCVCVTVLLVHLKLRRLVSLMLQLKCSSSSSSDSRRCSCKCSATLTSPCHAHKLTEFITWLSSSGNSSGSRSSSVVATCNKNFVLLAAKCSKLQQRMQIAPRVVEGGSGDDSTLLLSCT